MSMTAGSVTVADNEVATGTGLARELYDHDIASIDLPDVPALNSTAPPYSAARPSNADDQTLARQARLRLKREAARRAGSYAAALVDYLKDHAEIVISGVHHPLT